MVTKRILQKLIFDDDDFGNMFITCAKRYGNEYLQYKRFFNREYTEEIDLEFMVKHYDNIVRYWKANESFSEVIDHLTKDERKNYIGDK